MPQRPPERMSPSERRGELARLFGKAYIRARAGRLSSQNGLDPATELEAQCVLVDGAEITPAPGKDNP